MVVRDPERVEDTARDLRRLGGRVTLIKAKLLDAIVAAVVPCRSAHGGIEALVRSYLDFTRKRRDVAFFIHAQAHASFVPVRGPTIAARRTPRLEALHAWLTPPCRLGVAHPLAGTALRDAGRRPRRGDRASMAHDAS